MTVVWGAMLAAGLLLTLSPWLWPPQSAPRPTRDGRLRRLLDEAGYAGVPAKVPAIGAVLAAAVVAAVAWLVIPVPVVALLAAAAAALAVPLWLRSRGLRLLRRRRTLWPDVCDLLIGSVRAGMPLPAAVAALRQSAPPTLRPAFAGFAADLAASGRFDTSILRLKTVLSDPVADRILETLRMARAVGGTQLVPVLRALAASVRADAALRAEVESRQSWTRGAAVLGVVAPWVILVLLGLRPEGAEAYASAAGVVLILVGAGVSLVAYRLMLRLARLPEQRRWFA